MYMEENNQPLFKLLLNKTRIHTNKEMELAFMSRHAAAMLDRNEARINHAIQILTSAVLLCHQMNLNFDAVEHLGFIHVCERFEQFEREGWQ